MHTLFCDAHGIPLFWLRATALLHVWSPHTAQCSGGPVTHGVPAGSCAITSFIADFVKRTPSVLRLRGLLPAHSRFACVLWLTHCVARRAQATQGFSVRLLSHALTSRPSSQATETRYRWLSHKSACVSSEEQPKPLRDAPEDAPTMGRDTAPRRGAQLAAGLA